LEEYSKAAICIINPKNKPAFIGSLIVNSGIIKITYCVFTIEKSCCKLADRNTFKTKLPTTIPLVV